MFASLLLSLPRSRNSPLLVAVLNTTVAQMAKSVSMVLTMAYRDIYGEDEDAEDPAQLMLLTAPLAATEEVVALFAAGLAPCEIAMPAVLHAIGASKDEIDKAVEKACNTEEKQTAVQAEDRAFQKQDQALGLKERQAAMKAAPAKEKAEADQAQANVKQTEATTKKTIEEAKQAGKPQSPAGGSSSSSGSSSSGGSNK